MEWRTETKLIQIQEFNLNDWFEDVKKFETSFLYRKQLAFQPVQQERGFYYVIENVQDVRIIKDILVYILNIPNGHYGRFLRLIKKNEKLFLDVYMHLDPGLAQYIFNNEAERQLIQSKLQIHANHRNAVYTQIRNSLDPHAILRCILQFEHKSELAWRLTALRTSEFKTYIIEKIIVDIRADITINRQDYTDLIKRLERLGADAAFHSRTLTARIVEIFMEPFNLHDHNGWHDFYCEKIFTRLIFPILNVIERPDPNSNIDHDAFVTMMLCFFENLPENVLKIFPTQLITIFNLLARFEDTRRLQRFLNCLNRQGVQ